MKNEDIEDDINYDLFHHAVCIIAGSNMASEIEIKKSIKDLEEIIDTEYYDDNDGDILLKQIILYLKRKL